MYFTGKKRPRQFFRSVEIWLVRKVNAPIDSRPACDIGSVVRETYFEFFVSSRLAGTGANEFSSLV